MASEQEPTLSLAEFRSRYEADDNEWWMLSSGDHMNLFDEALEEIDRLQSARPDAATLRAEEAERALSLLLAELLRRSTVGEGDDSEALARRIESQANIAARPGQREELEQIAAEVRGLVPRPDAAKLREQIAAAFRHRPNEERPGDQTPGEIADRVLAVLAEHGLVDRDV